jgi:penicillin-binding protein 1A
MVSMMKDVIQRGTAAGSVGSQFRLPAGGKTGTTNDGTDVWFIGYTSDLVAGVWMGFDKPQTIKSNAQGGLLAAPAWTAFMNEVYRRKPAPPDWPRPEGIVVREIDPATGLLAGPGCSGSVTEYFIIGTDPVQQCMPTYGTPGMGYDSLTGQPYPLPTPYPPAPTPRLSTPADTSFSRGRPLPPRDSLRQRRDTIRPRRDSSHVPRDTTNPFTIPPRP